MKFQPDDLKKLIEKRIFKAGELQEALSDVYKFLSGAIPLMRAGWIQYHPDLLLIRTIAQASDAGGEKTNFMYDSPANIMGLATSIATPETYIINVPENDPLGEEVSKRAKMYDWSAVYINFKNSGGIYGSVVVLADGKNRYSEKHSRLLIRLKEPLQLILDALISDHSKKVDHPSQKEPVTDKNEFFRQVTRRLCGHLDLQTGSAQCLQYLSRFMPADALFVRQLEPGLLSERVLAESFGVFHKQSETIIPLGTDEPRPSKRKELPVTRIINRPEDFSSAHPYSQIFGTDWSSISMPLIHKKSQMGIAVLGLEGRNRYKEEHMQLFEMLHDPFVLALSNNIKHREVIRLKNIIEAEKKDLQEVLNYSSVNTIVGAGLGLKGVLDNARLVADQDSPVLLLGETGAGKEVVANFIHQKSSRKNGPLVKVNCGGIPDSLLDSELFGHEKGAFTGAVSRKMGRFERANGGTIFLDEIGELPPQAQVRLLRVLQNKVIERVGGTDPMPVDIRIIAATHRNLEEMVASGSFREDLWFRLNVFPIRIPPLRARRSDIPALVDHFIEKKSRELNLHQTPSLSPGAMGRLSSYAWPGNVRELENVIEREVILSNGRNLTFHSVIQQFPGVAAPENGGKDDDVLELDEVVKRHIKKALALSNGKINGPGGAAEMLKIKPNTLRNRMNKLGIPYGWKRRGVQ